MASKLSLALTVLLIITLSSAAYSYGGKIGTAAFACSCFGPEPLQEAFEESQAVFAGKVIDIETTTEMYPENIVTFDVHTTWKGILKDSAKVSTGTGNADCGYPFEENKEYLVYAYGDEDVGLAAQSCSQTKPLDRAEADLITLGQGDSTLAAERAETTGQLRMWSRPDSFLLAWITVVAVAGTAFAVIMVVKRRRRGKTQ